MGRLGKFLKGTGKALKKGTDIAGEATNANDAVRRAAKTGSDLGRAAAENALDIAKTGAKMVDNATGENAQGASVVPPVSKQPAPVQAPAKRQDLPPGVDRKTVFATGTLVLTRKGLVLYSHDERNILMEIPVELIASCRQGWKKGTLVVRKRVKIEENYGKYVEKLMKPTTNAKARRKNQVELQRLDADVDYAWATSLKKASVVSENFRLPDPNDLELAPSEECKTWVYMIRRRIAAKAMQHISSSPPDAVVVVDGVALGRTPVTFEKPLTETAALAGEYQVQVLLEGHEPKTLRISATPNGKSGNTDVQLSPRGASDSASDMTISAYRAELPDNSVNLNRYDLDLEVTGAVGILALAKNQVMVISHDKKKLLFAIPFKDMTGVKLDKKFMKGIQAITISYRDGELKLKYNFELDPDGASGDAGVLRRYCDAIEEKLRSIVHDQELESPTDSPHVPQGFPGGAPAQSTPMAPGRGAPAQSTPMAPGRGAPAQPGQSGSGQDDSKDYRDAIMYDPPDIEWDDVVGMETAKKTLDASLVYPALRPELFPMGWPSGLLLYGPPGTGKTMLAAATAKRLDGYFFNLHTASITSKWVGESEENVANMFKTAREHALKKPVVLFLDEADALLGADGTSKSGNTFAKNQFLTEMDGVHTKGKKLMLFVIGATNKPWDLDFAFLRRFPKRIYVPLPNQEARQILFEKYTGDLLLDAGVSMQDLSDMFDGYSGSDIRDVCQGAHIRTVHEMFESSGSDAAAGGGSADPRPVTVDDFQHMQSTRKPSVSPKMHKMYKDWSEKHETGQPGQSGPGEDDSKDYSEAIVHEPPNIEWDDVVGMETAKKTLDVSLVYPALRPELFPMGWPSGLLLYGPPGTGKTMLAAATAKRLDGYFFNLSAASITSKWVGESESNVANVFKTAREYAQKKPAVLFLDEADALLGSDDSNQTGNTFAKNQFLTEMDGVHTKDKDITLFIIGATNKPWALDFAFLRRFTKRIYVPLPNQEARQLLFEKYTGDLSLDAGVSMQDLSDMFDGYSGSDIKDVCQGAHIRTLHEMLESADSDSAGGGVSAADPRPVSMDDFQHILSTRKSSVSPEMHESYQQWSDKHGAG